MNGRHLLDAIRIESPCSQSWDSMQGNDEVRFCDHCVKHVHDLSAIREKDVRKLIAGADGSICVRYIRRPDGPVETLKHRLHQITRGAGIAAGVLGASLSVSALSYGQATTPSPTESSEISVELTVKETSSSGGSISGVVTDPNGAVINFALVTIYSIDGTFYRSAPTNLEGYYEFKDIPEGKYKLKIDAGGFDSKETGEFAVSADSLDKQDIQLQVSTLQEIVEVGDRVQVNEVLMGTMTCTTTTYVSKNKLIRAVQAEDVEEVKRLIGIGKKVNVKNLDSDGNFPLHYAVEHGNVEILELLLNAGAKISVKNYEKRTPLMMIDEDASAEMVNMLLRFGAAVNAADKDKSTVLILAAGDASEEVVRVLILNGADVNAQNKKGKTALMKAADEGNLENVKALLESGADVNLRDKSGESAWDMTSDEGVRQALVTFGAIPAQP